MPCWLISAIDLVDLLDEDRREAQRRLVEQQQLRLGHQRAAHREHLLLAAGHRARLLRLALLQAREQLEDALEVVADLGVVGAGERAELEVLAHGHAREAVAALGRLRDAQLDDLLWPAAADLLARRSGSCPSRGGVMPEIERSVVDLPAPLEPISVTISPSSTSARCP